jgi:cephalosporin hydroxylase
MKDANYDFIITQNSLFKNKEISNNMEGTTFHFHTHILYDIRTSLGDEEKTYLEIGSYAGGSQSLMSSHDYKTNCYSIDLGFPISKDIVIRNVNKFKNEKNTFKYFEGNSQDINIVNKVKTELNKVDILFIDGDHSRQGVFSDFKNYSDLVVDGGYIAFDDYLDFKYSPQVRGAVDEIVNNLNLNEYKIIGSIKYELIKEFTEFESNSIFLIQKLKS